MGDSALGPQCGGYGLEKELMDPPVGGQLGVKGGGHHRALKHQHGKAIAAGKDCDAGTGFKDAGGAYEDHLKRAAGQFGFSAEDGGVDLPAVGIALDGGIEQAQGTLGGIENLARQQNGAGAGTEDWFDGAELLQGIEEVVLFQEAEHGGRFAAGEDEPVQGSAVRAEIFRGFYQRRRCAGLEESLGVGGVVALEGKDADVWLEGCGQSDSVLWKLNGLRSSTPNGSKSFTLRVTTTSRWTRAVAAIRPSSQLGLECPFISRAHSRKISSLAGRISNPEVIRSIQPMISFAFCVSCRRVISTPFCSSPSVTAAR